jgi:SAM-dependent methyltransferase
MALFGLCVVALALVVLMPSVPLGAAEGTGSPIVTPSSEKPEHLVPYVPTPMEVVEEMLKMADVKSSDVVFDLGCGDGRIVAMAAKKFGARRAYGVDIDPVRVKEARELAQKEGVEKKVAIYEGDVFKTNFSSATVVTMYLLPEYNAQLRPNLEKMLAVGARVVSHDFDMPPIPTWKPIEARRFTDTNGHEHTIYFWKITTEMKKAAGLETKKLDTGKKGPKGEKSKREKGAKEGETPKKARKAKEAKG